MKNLTLTLLSFLAITATSLADVYIYNTTDERMTYQVQLPNGDTQDGVVKENTGYYPATTTISTKDGGITNITVKSESGESAVQLKAPYTRCYLIGKKDGGLQLKPISWSMDNGQTHKRELTLYNATGTTQTFSLIDEKEMRTLTIEPGSEVTVPAKYGFGGSSGFHHLKWADGHRLDNSVSAGSYHILYLDKRSPGKVQVDDYGLLTVPRNIVMP
ncbi:MAG: hypothetical protein WC314_12255 [Vulcanimicrobiota bacterium]